MNASIWNQTLVGWNVEVDYECHGTRTIRVSCHAELAAVIENCNVWGRTYRVRPVRA